MNNHILIKVMNKNKSVQRERATDCRVPREHTCANRIVTETLQKKVIDWLMHFSNYCDVNIHRTFFWCKVYSLISFKLKIFITCIFK